MLLSSRYGIKADPDFVKKQVMPGLAGAIDDNPSAVFDICEIVCILLIPYLKKEAFANDDDIFAKVVDMILADATGKDPGLQKPKLTAELMKQILATYGEDEIPIQVIDEMLAAAGSHGDATFDADALIQATTGDLTQYKVEWAESATTHYDDVFLGSELDFRKSKKNNSDDSADEENEGTTIEPNLVRRDYSSPTIDYVAENYRSKTFTIFIWILGIVAFFAYALEFQSNVGKRSCDEFRSEFGCRIVNAIISWLIVFAELRYVRS